MSENNSPTYAQTNNFKSNHNMKVFGSNYKCGDCSAKFSKTCSLNLNINLRKYLIQVIK